MAVYNILGPCETLYKMWKDRKGKSQVKYIVIVDDNSCLYQSLVLERCPSELFGSRANTCEGNRCSDCWHNAMQLYAEKVTDNEK